MKKAVIYARFSSSKQNETSISGQLNTCNNYADQNRYEVIDTYIDRAISGTTDNRPQFQQMIKDSHTGAFDVVLVYATDRFSRDRHDSIYYKKELKENGVKVISCSESIPEDDNGILIESIYEALSEMYIHNLRKNVKRGRNERAKNSESVGGVTPLGYEIKNRKYVIKEPEAEIVRIIFRMYADGRQKKEIADYLNSQGFRTGRGNKFKVNSFSAILKNRKYLGIYKVNDIENVGGMPRIIDDRTFNMAQKRLEDFRSSKRGIVRKKYILTGKAFCAECGSHMTGVTGHGNSKTYHYYRCKNKCVSVWSDTLEKTASEMTLQLLLDDKLKKMIIDTTYDYYQQDYNIDYISPLELALQENKKMIDDTVDAIAHGYRSEFIKSKLEALEEQHNQIKSDLEKEYKNKEFEITREDISRALESIVEHGLESLEDNKILFDSFINRVLVSKDKKISIEYSILNDTDNEEFNQNTNGGTLKTIVEHNNFIVSFYGNFFNLLYKLYY